MKIKITQQGFSLVETLVAITILLLVIVGPMSISSQSTKSTSFASEQVIAFFLAQEGAELVQKGRDDLFNRFFLPDSDTNRVSNPWAVFTTGAFYSSCYNQTNGCAIEIQRDSVGSLAVSPCNIGNNNCSLLLDDTTNSTLRSRYTFLNTGSVKSTPYRRVIKLDRVSANEVKIVSTVYWKNGNTRNEQSTSIETYLFNTYADN